MLLHKPNYEDQSSDFYKLLKTKLVLLNKLGGVLGSSELYFFDKDKNQFGLVNVEKKFLQIIL